MNPRGKPLASGFNNKSAISLPTTVELGQRLEERISAWQVVVERIEETPTSLLAFGGREQRPVILKLIKSLGDEWHSGEVLDAFEGAGVVRVFEHLPGALLLERLCPGTRLVDLVLRGDDDDATSVLAAIIGKMSPRRTIANAPTVEDWGKGFDRYAAGNQTQIPRPLLLEAQRLHEELCASQSQSRLLHGDLHHDNVLFDADRGWLAIDPKGVIGELEYEVGAALRNPTERPELFTDPETIEKRVQGFARTLTLNPGRILAWAFVQAVLSAVWLVEDGFPVDSGHQTIALANTIRPMLDRAVDA
jgi:streptomycin 6-kinase